MDEKAPGERAAAQFSDDWLYQYFFVLPMSGIKAYNRDVVSSIVHRRILENLGDFDRGAFPPVLESWSSPASVCIKASCTRKVFEKIRRECRRVYTDFGGSPDVFLCYQTSGEVP